MDRTLRERLDRAKWIILIAIGVAAAIFYIFPLIYPFLLGWLLAYLIQPIVGYLQRKAKFPRWAAVTVTLTAFLGLFFTFIALLVTRIVVEINNLINLIVHNSDRWADEMVNFFESDFLQDIIDQLSRFYKENPNYQETINKNIESTAKTLTDAGTNIITFFLNSIVSIISSLPSFGAISIVVLLAAFFISKNWQKLLSNLSRWTPQATRSTTSAIWFDLQKALFGYVRAQLIMISITGVFVTIGLLILDVKYAITIGLLIAFVDLLPYLGTGFVMVPWTIYLYIYGDLHLAIGMSILYGIVLVTRQIIEPKVLASSIGLDPLATLIAMFVGLKIFGVLGLIIGPVSLVILTAINRSNVFRDLWRYIMHGKQKPS